MSDLVLSLKWPDKDEGPWLITLEWEEMGGRLDVASCTIARPDLAEPVTASVLRSIPLGRLTSQGRRESAEWLEREIHELNSIKAFDKDDWAKIAEFREMWTDSAPRKGRPGYPPDYYRQVAEVYAMAWAAGERPTKAVAEKWAVNSATAAKWVSKARKLGFLDPTERGRAGGVSARVNPAAVSIVTTVPPPKVRKSSAKRKQPRKKESK